MLLLESFSAGATYDNLTIEFSDKAQEVFRLVGGRGRRLEENVNWSGLKL